MVIRTGNMDEAAQNAMVRMSLVSLTIGVGGAVALALAGLPVLYRLALFVPFALSASWLLQAIGRT